MATDALHAVEEIQKNRLLSEVTKRGYTICPAFFASIPSEIPRNLGNFVLSRVPHPKWQLTCKMRKIHDERNEVIVYFDQRGPGKAMKTNHGAYAISTAKKGCKKRNNRDSEKLVRSKHLRWERGEHREWQSKECCTQKMEYEDSSDVKMDRLEKGYQVDSLLIADRFFTSNDQPSGPPFH